MIGTREVHYGSIISFFTMPMHSTNSMKTFKALMLIILAKIKYAVSMKVKFTRLTYYLLTEGGRQYFRPHPQHKRIPDAVHI